MFFLFNIEGMVDTELGLGVFQAARAFVILIPACDKNQCASRDAFTALADRGRDAKPVDNFPDLFGSPIIPALGMEDEVSFLSIFDVGVNKLFKFLVISFINETRQSHHDKLVMIFEDFKFRRFD